MTTATQQPTAAALSADEAAELIGLVRKPFEGDDHEAVGDQSGSAQERLSHRLVAVAAAQGSSRDEIAEQFGYGSTQVARILRLPWVKDLVLRIQANRQLSVEQRLRTMAPHALDTLGDLLSAESENVRAAVARDLLDRVLGKAIQRSENVNINATPSDVQELNSEMSHLDEQLEEIRKRKQQLRDTYRNDPDKAKELVGMVDLPKEALTDV